MQQKVRKTPTLVFVCGTRPAVFIVWKAWRGGEEASTRPKRLRHMHFNCR